MGTLSLRPAHQLSRQVPDPGTAARIPPTPCQPTECGKLARRWAELPWEPRKRRTLIVGSPYAPSTSSTDLTAGVAGLGFAPIGRAVSGTSTPTSTSATALPPTPDAVPPRPATAYATSSKTNRRRQAAQHPCLAGGVAPPYWRLGVRPGRGPTPCSGDLQTTHVRIERRVAAVRASLRLGQGGHREHVAAERCCLVRPARQAP